MTLTPDRNLFEDFEADSCVIVHDPSAFAQRLKDAVQLQLPGWDSLCGCVQYIDTYAPNPRDFMKPDIDLCFTKLRSHSYQQEFRFAWVLPQDQERQDPLKAFKVQLGSLEQIAEFVGK